VKAVLADTSYYIAILSERDAAHDAVDLTANLLGAKVLSEYVLVELGNALSRSKDRGRFAPFVDRLLSDEDTVFIPASRKLVHRGFELYRARADKAWSMVDCISFTIMRQRRISDALTTDEHFEQAGFRALLRGGRSS
jgi:predicted nucleic acid-binding protein